MTLVLMCAALVTSGPTSDPAPPPDVRQEYREARAHAGRSPEEQVKLALWCEAHGLSAERLNHLALAVLADPANATARGLMGLVTYRGRWQRPEAVAEKLGADVDLVATLAEYDARRLKAPYTADGQWSLGVWADEHGLKDQAKAHFTAVTRLDPSREHAWKRLGYKRAGNRWATDAQLAAEHAEAGAQKLADRRWIPVLDKYKAMLDQPSKRAEAESALATVDDPRAVPSIVRAFTNRAVDQPRAVQLLGQVDAPSASRALAALAVFPKSAEVRRAAVETLRRRDPRDFVRLWIGLVRQPIQYEVKPVGGPGSPGTLLVEGRKVNVQRVYAPPPMPNIANVPGSGLSYDDNGLPVLTQPIGMVQASGRVVNLPHHSYDVSSLGTAIANAGHGANLETSIRNQARTGHPVDTVTGFDSYLWNDEGLFPIVLPPRLPGLDGRGPLVQRKDVKIPIGQMALEFQKSAMVAQQQLSNDVTSIERANEAIRRSNEPALQALKAVTGRELGDDPVAWSKWWTDQEGYVFHLTATEDRTTIVENIPLGYTPQAVPQVISGAVSAGAHHSCFGAGTPVRTIDGMRPIESIRAGDLVLSQDTKAGGLAYRPVVAVYHNPPAATLRVTLGDESVVATGIHRFWKVGKGWTMARDLKVGDPIRTLGGLAPVASVEDDRTRPVFNLAVADGRSFLVGELGALVHDNSLVEATPAPFDAVAVAAVPAAK